jgi:AcrR family transcriptional regulator
MSRTQSNIQQRKAREAEARREHIFAVVKALIKKGGAREVTIRKVAQEAGFSTTVVYSLFHDKATLITRAMDADLLELVGSMKKGAAGGTGPLQRLRLAGYAYMRFGMERPDEYALVFMEPRPHAPVEAAEVEHGNVDQDPYAFAFSLLQAVAVGELGYALQDGALSEADAATVHLMTQVFWQGLHGMVSLGIVMGEDDVWAPFIAPQTNAEALLDVLIAGITQRFRRPDA